MQDSTMCNCSIDMCTDKAFKLLDNGSAGPKHVGDSSNDTAWGEIGLDLKKAFLQGGRMPLVGHFKMAACSSRKPCLPMAVPWWGRFLKGGGF